MDKRFVPDNNLFFSQQRENALGIYYCDCENFNLRKIDPNVYVYLFFLNTFVRIRPFFHINYIHIIYITFCVRHFFD